MPAAQGSAEITTVNAEHAEHAESDGNRSALHARRHGEREIRYRDRLRSAFILAVMTRAAPVPDADTPAALAILLENHRAFLRYLERRVGDRALAEDILQDAFIKVMARPEQAPADEAAVPWFYRTLRNAAIDLYRRQGAVTRAVEAFAHELETHAAPEPEMETEICACVTRLAGTLKAEYAEALQAIDVKGEGVKAFAEQRGLSASNAGSGFFGRAKPSRSE